MTRDQYADRLQVLVAFFETLTLAHVAVLRELYAPDAYFKDPFNEVHSVTDIERIFTHMFQQVQAPRFVVSDAVQQGDQAFLVWTFHFRMPGAGGAEQCIRGSTHVRFRPDGKVSHHRDYWDAAEELYAKLPVLGWLMRGLQRRVRAPLVR